MKSINKTIILIIVIFLRSILALFACDDVGQPIEINDRTGLMEAIANKKVERATILIDMDTDINERQYYKNEFSDKDRTYKTPLYYAIDNKMVNLTQILLEKGARQNATFHYDSSVRHIKIEEWGIPELEIDEHHAVEIYLALKKENKEIFNLLIEYYPDKSKLPILDLFCAAMAYEDSSFLEILLKYKLDIYMPENYIETVLINAINSGAKGSVQFLMDRYGSNKFFNDHQNTILTETASLWGGLSLMEYLLKEYSNTVSINEYQNELIELIYQASSSNNIDMVRLLFNTYKNLSPEKSQLTKTINKALFSCLDNREIVALPLVSFFLEQDASLTHTNIDGRPILIIAVSKRYDNIISLLLEAGADPDYQDLQGKSALEYAEILRASLEAKQILRKYTTNVQKSNISNITTTSSLSGSKIYNGEFAFDETGYNAWIEGSSGSGIGNSITIQFTDAIQFDSISFSDDDNNLENILLNDITGVTINGVGVRSERNGSGKFCNLNQSIQSRNVTINLSQISTKKVTENTGIWNLCFYLNSEKIILNKSNIEYSTQTFNKYIPHKRLTQKNTYNRNIAQYRKRILNPFNYGASIDDQYYGDFYNYDQHNVLRWILSVENPDIYAHSYFLDDSGSVFFMESKGNEEDKNIIVVWINKRGQLVRSLSYGGLGIDALDKVIPLDNGEYLLIGASNSFGESKEAPFTPWFIRITKTGDILWQKSLPEIELNNYYSTSKRRNNNYGIKYQIEKISRDSVAIVANDNLFIINTSGRITNGWSTNGIDKIQRKSDNKLYIFRCKEIRRQRRFQIIDADISSKNFNQVGIYNGDEIFDSPGSKEFISEFHTIGNYNITSSKLLCDGELLLNFDTYVNVPHAIAPCFDTLTISKFDPEKKISQNHCFTENSPIAITTSTLPQAAFAESFNLSFFGTYSKTFQTNPFYTTPNVPNLNVRNIPGLFGNVIYQINENVRVRILERSERTSMIGPMEAYWYKIALPAISDTSPKEGWVYGYFLGIFKDEI